MIARQVVFGTPVKEVARIYKLESETVRRWRDELCELGADAFAAKGVQRFSKHFREEAVRRVERGTPLKQVARSCRITPSLLCRWRQKLRTLGERAFAKPQVRRKVIVISLSEDEQARLKVIAKAAGARSVSDFVRSRLLA